MSVRAVLPALLRAVLEPALPSGLTVDWFTSPDDALALAPRAEIAWLDMEDKVSLGRVLLAAERLKWLNTVYTGLDGMPLDVLAARGVVVTNGAGLSAINVSEYTLMAMLAVAKGYAETVGLQGRREWPAQAHPQREIAGSNVLLIGYGPIGRAIEQRLAGFEVTLTKVRRSPDPDCLAPGEWQARLGEFDWIVLAVPGLPATRHMIGAAELAAMKPDAWIVNIARGMVIDQDALVEALEQRRIGGAFLDVTTPEPLPPGHPLWRLPNAHVSMHLSGRMQEKFVARAVARFRGNLGHYLSGQPLVHAVDLGRGY